MFNFLHLSVIIKLAAPGLVWNCHKRLYGQMRTAGRMNLYDFLFGTTASLIFIIYLLIISCQTAMMKCNHFGDALTLILPKAIATYK